MIPPKKEPQFQTAGAVSLKRFTSDDELIVYVEVFPSVDVVV